MLGEKFMKDTTLYEHQSHVHIGEDIGIYYCGKRIKTVGHSYGPKTRDHYLLVLVNSGKATLHGKNERILKEHDLFVMCPGEKIHYTALTPWSIQWVGVYGKAVEEYMGRLNINGENPVISVPLYRELEAVLESLYQSADTPTASSALMQISLIYKLFSILFECADNKSDVSYSDVAKRIIDYNFADGLTVKGLAGELCLNTAYFTRLFTKSCGISPKKYIINKQIEKAKSLLASTDMTVSEVASSVGFTEQMYFSRIFKKMTSLTPTEYRALSLANI